MIWAHDTVLMDSEVKKYLTVPSKWVIAAFPPCSLNITHFYFPKLGTLPTEDEVCLSVIG